MGDLAMWTQADDRRAQRRADGQFQHKIRIFAAKLLVIVAILIAVPTAVDNRANRNEVSKGVSRDRWTGLDHVADYFMTLYHRIAFWNERCPPVAQEMEIGVANAAVQDLRQRIVFSNVATIEGDQCKRGGKSKAESKRCACTCPSVPVFHG